MHILILDADAGHGALLASACKKLGHKVKHVQSLAEAQEMLQSPEIQALCIAIGTGPEGGLALAKTLRATGEMRPLAFSTGTCTDQDAIAKAAEAGPVLPKVWTHADLKVILQDLYRGVKRRRTLETSSDVFPGDPSPAAVAKGFVPGEIKSSLKTYPSIVPENATPDVARAIGELKKDTPRIKIRCTDWDQVGTLCRDIAQGITTITVRARSALYQGQEILVQLALPDELVLAIEATVLATRPVGSDGKTPYQVDLRGLREEELHYMRGQVEANTEVTLDGTIDDFGPLDGSLPSSRDSIELSEELLNDAIPKISWDS